MLRLFTSSASSMILPELTLMSSVSTVPITAETPPEEERIFAMPIRPFCSMLILPEEESISNVLQSPSQLILILPEEALTFNELLLPFWLRVIFPEDTLTSMSEAEQSMTTLPDEERVFRLPVAKPSRLMSPEETSIMKSSNSLSAGSVISRDLSILLKLIIFVETQYLT